MQRESTRQSPYLPIVGKDILLLISVLLFVFSGCQKISSIPTSEDSFIIVPPTDLSVFVASDASIEIYWQPVSAVGFFYYNVYFGTSSKSLHLITETSYDFFFIDSLSYDSTYYFQVTAVYFNDSESTPSNIVSAEPINRYHPQIPAGLVVQGHNDNSGKYMTVIWSANPDGDIGGYEIYRDSSATFTPDTTSFSNLAATTKTNTYRDSLSLKLDRTYYYKIVAFDFDHWRSPPSSSASDQILDRPELVSPADNSTLNAGNDLVFTYSNVAGANGYVFYISASSNGGDVYTTTLPANQDSLLLSGSSLNPNQLYFWHVAATTLDPNTPNSVSNAYSFTLTQ